MRPYSKVYSKVHSKGYSMLGLYWVLLFCGNAPGYTRLLEVRSSAAVIILGS